MSGNDELMAQLFGRAPRVAEYRLTREVAAATAVTMTAVAMPRATGGRYIPQKPKVGPRGGDDRFRAAAKAARKARQKQRKHK